ncbi:MAG: flagellar biosynthetic protein FliR [Bdellovibrionales bacterium]|nr:flagellar biosynthetic protein FliR [Bdellovibrionales bacterium]
MRISAFVVAWPVFGMGQMPNLTKVLFALVVAFVVFPVVGWGHVTQDLQSGLIVWMTIREVFIGLAFGFLARIFFFVASIGGQLASVSMGISSAQLFSPATGESTSALEKVQVILATIFFLTIDGHLIFLSGLVDSYQLLPLSVSGVDVAVFGTFGQLLGEVMLIGVKVAAPVMIAVLFMNLTMAVIGRAVPQINVLITSLPVNILVGFLILILAMPLMVWQMGDILEYSVDRVFSVLKAM